MNNFPLEPDVRLQIDERLKNLGWVMSGAKKNVFLEQPKTEDEKRRLKGKRPDYVLYEKGKDTPLIVIETKKAGSNINLALEQGRHYAAVLNAPLVFATDGVYYKSMHTGTNLPLFLNGEEVDELLREVTAIQYLQGGSNVLDTISRQVQLSRQELISIFEEANNVLRVEGLRAGIERFSEFANILFLKLFSEIDNLREEPEFDRKLKWDFYKNKPSDEILNYLNDSVLPRISRIYGDNKIFSPLHIKDGKVLKKIIDKLDPLVLTDINSDIKGDAFEYFLRNTSGTGNDLGEYFTPRHIVKMMVKLVNPRIGEKVYDPFCGTGGLLIESFRHIYNTMPRNARTLKQLKEDTIFGNEITNTARITKMNMILAGDGRSNIQMINSLANPMESKFDVVITNMPYAQSTEYGSLYDLPSKNGDSICVQHCIRAIDKTAENGRIAMVVPEGFLFRKDLQKTREYLLKTCDLKSIISLPQGVFLPYTGVKTDIVYLTKVKQSSTKNGFLYFDIKHDGYTLDNQRREIPGTNDVKKFLENRNVDNQKKEENSAAGFEFISLKDVAANAYILSGNQYKSPANTGRRKHKFVALPEVAGFVRGVTFSKSEQLHFDTPTSIKIATTRACQEFGLVGKHMYIIEAALVKDEKKLLREGDILISLANSLDLVGRVTYINKLEDKVSFGAFMGLIRPDRNLIDPVYLFYILRTKEAKEFFLNNARTTTNISNLNFSILEKLQIPLPDLATQKKIVEKITRINQSIGEYKNKIEGLDKDLKDTIQDVW